jgi:oxygen-independent coproporphyrinogen-3 oxidase
MDWTILLYAVLLMGIAGVVLGGVIAIFVKIFRVESDPRIDLALELLPGANCGGCGKAGCADFAKALAAGEVTPANCPVSSSEQISAILREIYDNFNVENSAEITLEANPNTLTAEKLEMLRISGINRLSMGIQSMNDEELKILGRTHTAERAVKAVYDAKSAGFDNISCDLMAALPNQTEEMLIRSIDAMAELPIQHISAYILKIEEGTPFDCMEIREKIPDEDTSAELYTAMVNRLREKGFFQYEVSNFAKKGFESRHNSRYWKCLDYIGIGPSAHSCYKGARFAVSGDLQGFINSPIQITEITDSSPCGFEEYAMLRLRLAEGYDLNDFPQHKDDLIKKIPPLLKAGYITYNGEKIALTESGFLMSNSVIEYLIF